MKTYKKLFFLVIVITFLLRTGMADAALVPSLSISAITGSTSAQITVFGADPNMSVMLYYPSTSSMASANIGTTNSSGYLNSTVNASTYNIASGATVYVVVDGQASQASTWPSYNTTSGSLSLSQTSVILSAGQSSVVSASVSASLSMTSNTNPSVASVSISGNQVTINAFNSGVSNITICASNIGCSVIYVTVQTSNASQPSVSFGQSSYGISVGQSQTISISGAGTYSISSNLNSAIASASINGSILTVGGVSAGTDTISICASNSSSEACSSVNIVVAQSINSNNSTTQSSLSFSSSNVNLSVGQTQTVSVSGGSGVYSVSGNSSTSSVYANVNGSTVSLVGSAYGGSNVKICDLVNVCGYIYAYVSSLGNTATTVQSNQVPTLASFSLVSSTAGNTFVDTGSVLNFTFSANQSVSTPVITVAGSALTVNGTGSGPYTASYTIKGNETLPLGINITMTNTAGRSGQAYLSIGNSSIASTVSSSVSSSPVSLSSVSSSSSGTFASYLYEGITEQGVSNTEVVALQKRLKSDGYFTGSVTGYFGPLTKAALESYQTKNGLSAVGVVGPSTRALLNKGI